MTHCSGKGTLVPHFGPIVKGQGSIQDFLLGGGNIFIECAEADV